MAGDTADDKADAMGGDKACLDFVAGDASGVKLSRIYVLYEQKVQEVTG